MMKNTENQKTILMSSFFQLKDQVSKAKKIIFKLCKKMTF